MVWWVSYRLILVAIDELIINIVLFLLRTSLNKALKGWKTKLTTTGKLLLDWRHQWCLMSRIAILHYRASDFNVLLARSRNCLIKARRLLANRRPLLRRLTENLIMRLVNYDLLWKHSLTILQFDRILGLIYICGPFFSYAKLWRKLCSFHGSLKRSQRCTWLEFNLASKIAHQNDKKYGQKTYWLLTDCIKDWVWWWFLEFEGLIDNSLW